MALNSSLSETPTISTPLLSSTSLSSHIGHSSDAPASLPTSTSGTVLSPSTIQASTSTSSSALRKSMSSVVSDSASITSGTSVTTPNTTTSTQRVLSTMSSIALPASTSSRPPSNGNDPDSPPDTASSPSSSPPTTTSSSPPPSSSPRPSPSPPATSSKPPSPAPKPTSTPNPGPPPSSQQQKPATSNQPPATTQAPAPNQAPASNTQVKPASSVTSESPASPSTSTAETSGNSRSTNGSAVLTSSVSHKSPVVPMADSTVASPSIPIMPSDGASKILPGGTPPPSHSVSTSFTTVHHSGFFSQEGKVAGVFVAVGITVLAILALIPWLLARYRRRRNEARPRPRNPSMASYGDLHYRRTSQIQAFGNVLSTGASSNRPTSARGSDDSHLMSSETHHSSEPIITRGLSSFRNIVTPPSRAREGYTNGYTTISSHPEMTKTPLPTVPELPVLSSNLYPDVINAALHRNGSTPPLKSTSSQMNYSRPRPTNSNLGAVDPAYLQPPRPIADPFTGHSRGSSPSLYPPTIPSDDDRENEEAYWRKQGFERVSDSEPLSATSTSAQLLKVLPTPPDSALGLRFGPESNVSQASLKQGIASDEESDLVGSLHPRMEPTSIHTAPITMPSRYPILGQRVST